MKTRLLLLITVLLGCLTTLSPALSPAHAEKLGPGRVGMPGFSGYVARDGSELGIGRLGNGVYGVCLDTGPSLRWPAGTPGSRLVSHAEAGYLTSTYLARARTNGRIAAALWWSLGGSLGLNSHPERVTDHVAKLRAEAPGIYTDVAAWHDRMMREARQLSAGQAGYRTGSLAVTRSQVTGIGAVSSTGHYVPGAAVSVTIKGARFRNGTTTWHGTTGGSARSIAVQPGSTAAVTVVEQITGLPARTFRLYDAGGSTQRVAASAGATTARGTASLGAVRAKAAPPVRLVVTKHAEGNDPAGLVGVRFEVRRDSAAGPLIDAHTFTAADVHGGVASVTSVPHYDATRHYVAVLTGEPRGWVPADTEVPVQVAGSGLAVDFTDLKIWQPRLATMASAAVAAPGTPLSDTVLASDTGGHDVPGAWRLLGPVAPAATGCDGVDWSAAPVLAMGTFAVPGDGTYDVGPVTPTTTGCYTWSEQVAATELTSATAWTTPGASVETTLVRSAPALATRANRVRAIAGRALADQVQVTGLAAGAASAPVAAAWRLLGPVAPRHGQCRGLDWAHAPLAGSGTFTVSHDGIATVGRREVTAGGCYTWSEALAATATSAGVDWTTPGIAEETTVVMPRRAAVPAHPSVPAGGEAFRRAAPAGPTGAGSITVRSVGLAAPLVGVAFHGATLTPPADLALGGLWRDGAGLDAVVGTTVLVGHVSDDHDRPGEFHRLGGVRPGEGITTTSRTGVVERWRVTRVRLTPKRVLPASLFSQGLTRRLVLITCGNEEHHADGTFHYRSNLIVEAVPR